MCSSTRQATGCPVHDPVTPNRIKVNSNRYNFQRVFPESEGLEDLFDELEPTVLSVLDGHNVCILSHELVRCSDAGFNVAAWPITSTMCTDKSWWCACDHVCCAAD